MKIFKGTDNQDKFIKGIQGTMFDFGLVFTQAFLKGIRDIGYKSTATALFESIDNSIQAESGNIHIIMDFNKGNSNKGMPARIAVIDDGHGMSPEMTRISVLWGGSHRIDSRDGFGKYGYGLPSSCVSIGEKFSVYSKREDAKNWSNVEIDVVEIAHNDPKYINPKTGRIIAPEATNKNLPTFVEAYLHNKKIKLNHGTVVIIDKIDRLTYKTKGHLKDFLIQQCGVTYRNFLRQVNLYVDGTSVEPIDPLFITDGYRYYDEDDDGAVSLPQLKVKVKDKGTKDEIGEIRVRFSYMPPTFLRKEEYKMMKNAPSNAGNKRLSIRKDNNGIIALRAGRQIDVISSKCPWTTFQNNDRYIGIEIDFPPSLDEEFSITTAKQQVVISERMWSILEDNGVREALSNLRSLYKKANNEHKKKIGEIIKEEKRIQKELAAQAMAESKKDHEVDPNQIPIDQKKDGEKNFDKEVDDRSTKSGVDKKTIREHLESEITNWPYKKNFIEEEEGQFYKVKQIGGQINIYINKAHRFYTDLYDNDETSDSTRAALEILLFVLAESELRVTSEKRSFYKIERNTWSMKLDSALDKLSQYLAENEDDEIFNEELDSSILQFEEEKASKISEPNVSEESEK